MTRVAFITGLALLAYGAAPLHAAEPRSTGEILAMIDAAPEHATVRVPTGVYRGRLSVQKAVRLEGGGEVVIDGGGEGNVVELLAPGIEFRGFTVRGSGSRVETEPAAIFAGAGPVVIEDCRIDDALFGIDLRRASGSTVRGNFVRGRDFEPGRSGDGVRLWWSHDCVIERNTVVNSRDMVFWYSTNLRIVGNRVSDSRYGLHFMYSHDALVEDNIVTRNSVGAYLMYSQGITVRRNSMTRNRGASGYGIGLKDCDDILIESNALLANRVGVYIDNSPSSTESTGLFEQNTFAFNEIGLLATPNTHSNVFTANAFIENEEQAGVHGRGALALNAFAKDGVGNFWSDYNGFDRSGDGVGDMPYEPRSLFENMLAREPNLRFFLHSPAQRAVEFTARALPELRPQPKLFDPRPLVRPPEIVAPAASEPTQGRGAMAAISLALVGVASLTAWRLCRDPAPINSERTRR